MNERNEKNTEYDLADIITGKPHEFTINRKVLRLYPITLAKQLMLRWYIDALEINEEVLSRTPEVEALRLVVTKKEVCCSILAIYTTPNTYKGLFNLKKRAERRNLLSKADNADLAALLLTALTSDRTEQVIKHLELDKENERMERVLTVKKDSSKNSISFGGKSIFGAFIGQLKEMGFTTDEILFERSYSFLRLVLADKVTSIYLSDDEYSRVSALDAGGDAMDGNDPEAAGRILSSLANRGIKIQ